MAVGDLTNVHAVKGWLGLAGTSDDGLLARLIAGTSAAMCAHVNRPLLASSFAERLNGTGGTRLQLPNYPVLSVATVFVGATAIQQSPDGVLPGWVADDRGITLVGGLRFTAGMRNVSMAYTAGFEQVPADLEQACVEWCAFKYRERDRIGHSSKSVQGETVSFITKDMPDSVRSVLAQYRKVAPT